MLPLYEAKMIHHYDTRWASYEPDGSTREVTPEEKRAGFAVLPRYWVDEGEVEKKLEGKWDKPWMLGWRDICRSTDERTVIACQVPRVGYGDPWLIALPSRGRQEIQAMWSSFVFDFVARQKFSGTHLKFFTFVQLPTPRPSQIKEWTPWIAKRVDALNSQRLDEVAREKTRAELDGLMFHVYGVSRADTEYIMNTFPIVKRKEEAVFGEYRTKRLILAQYDRIGSSQ